MAQTLLCRMRDTRTTLRLRALGTWRERLRGLLGTDADTCPVALVRCASVHTWGMRYRIDVALVSRGGEVLRVRRAMPPNRVLSCAGAYYALERPASHDAWPREGSWVALAIVARRDDGCAGASARRDSERRSV